MTTGRADVAARHETQESRRNGYYCALHKSLGCIVDSSTTPRVLACSRWSVIVSPSCPWSSCFVWSPRPRGVQLGMAKARRGTTRHADHRSADISGKMKHVFE